MRNACTVLSLFLFSLVASAEQYLCVPDKMTGFAYDEKTKAWITTQFRTDFKYIIASAKNGRDAFTLTKIGEKEPEGYCKDGFNDPGYLHCENLGGYFKFNRANGRYLAVFTLAYYNVGVGLLSQSDSGSDTPAMQIGKCSPF